MIQGSTLTAPSGLTIRGNSCKSEVATELHSRASRGGTLYAGAAEQVPQVPRPRDQC